jgi:hypothetical protein
MDSLPYADAVPYNDMVLRVPLMKELLQDGEPIPAPAMGLASAVVGTPAPPAATSAAHGDLMAHLRAVPDAEIRRKQALLRRYAPLLAYSYPKLQPSVRSAATRPRADNAVSMAIARLAEAVAPSA